MNPASYLLQRQTEILDKAERQWQDNRRSGTYRKLFTIALSREPGTQGTSLAIALGNHLGWPVYDHQLVERIAQELGLRSQLLESVDEKRKSWLLECVEGFVTGAGVHSMVYVRQLTQTILALGENGHCIIVGRGAAHILPRETTLRVRLVGDLEDRVTWAAKTQNLSREKAVLWVEETERQRRAFVQDNFLKDTTDPHQYDLVLNSSRWPVESGVEIIVQALKKMEGK